MTGVIGSIDVVVADVVVGSGAAGEVVGAVVPGTEVVATAPVVGAPVAVDAAVSSSLSEQPANSSAVSPIDTVSTLALRRSFMPGHSCRLTGRMEYTRVTPEAFAALDGMDDWRFVLGSIHGTFRTGSFPAAATLVTVIADAAEQAGHHPDLDIRYPGDVDVSLSTHDAGGLTTLDVELARTISALAADHLAPSAPTTTQCLEFAIDTMDADRIRPFWAAVLGYRERNGNLEDPRRLGPPMWFQEMTEPRPQRNRIHLDLSVPHDVAEERVAAALAAGGTLVSDAHARSWWVLADADGNEICVCTWQDR
jgi:4a-hydroxytetrahydrobiopterin dehydratase